MLAIVDQPTPVRPFGLDVGTLAQFKVVLQLVEPTVGMLGGRSPRSASPFGVSDDVRIGSTTAMAAVRPARLQYLR
jgi:hypothetical protein